MKRPSIPGTFRSQPSLPIRDRSLAANEIAQMIIAEGALVAECYLVGECRVIVSRDPMHGEYRWHISISHPTRYPTWDEIKTACYGIDALDGLLLAQILAPGDGSEWVDIHKNCFHLYEVHDQVLR